MYMTINQKSTTMKAIFVLLICLKLCNSENKFIPKDNHHYVEGDSRYFWSYDTHGDATLIDLKEKPDQRVVDAHAVSDWINYFFFRRFNIGDQPYRIKFGKVENLKKKNFNPDQPLNVLIHDWNGHANSRAVRRISEALLYRSDCNVIIVGWKTVSKSSYVTAAHSVANVGSNVASLIRWLVDNNQAKFTRIHIIGFGMGAHVAGVVGRKLGRQVSRITALDPLGPLFNSELSAIKISASDAIYVEGIHTTYGLMGSNTPVGRADFFPNGGIHPQLGCVDLGCSHNRAFEYFSSSVLYDNMKGRKCSTESEANRNIGCQGPAAKLGTVAYKKSLDGLYNVVIAKGKWPFF